MKLHRLIEQHWHTPKPWLQALLFPFSRLFERIAGYRRKRYLSGSLKSQKLPVPVVIVGNIHAGGTGKTPVTSALVTALQQRGLRVGIISRGYGRSLNTPHLLSAHSSAAEAGDEPLLLYRQTRAPAAVAADRYAAGCLLLEAHPDTDIIVADDGLQHYALHRDVEIAVFPAADCNRRLDVLPNGCLREPLGRLQHTDALVFSQAENGIPSQAAQQLGLSEHFPMFHSHIRPDLPYRLNQPEQILHPDRLPEHTVCTAIAAIARPQRFFDSLKQLGFHLNHTVTLPDHAAIDPAALPENGCIFITEKDAVKLSGSLNRNIWVLPVRAQIMPDLAEFVAEKCGL